jgi:hypothetical protein
MALDSRCDPETGHYTVRGFSMKSCRLTAGAMSILLAISPTGSTSASAGPTRAAASSVGDAQGCTPLELIRTRYLWANGNEVSPAAPPEVKQLAATELTYELPSGSVMTEISEPYIVGPPRVAPAILRAFGYDARQAAYRNYTKTYPSTTPCIGWKRMGSTPFAERHTGH